MPRSSHRLPWVVYPGFALGVVGLVLLLAPPFLLPSAVYDTVYGWRFPQGWECGDALVTDRGPRVPADRFTVDVGERSRAEELTMCRLPKESLEVMLLLPSESASRPSVQLFRTAKTEGAEPIPVGEWSGDSDWRPSESPVPGWSAFRAEEPFDAVPSAEYLLRLEPVPDAVVRLVFVGGGWQR